MSTKGGRALGQMREETDEQLVERANGGESEAFEELYYRYRGWVHALGWRFVGDEELAGDVVQEVFMYLLGKFPAVVRKGARKGGQTLEEKGSDHIFRLTSKMTSYLYPVTRHIALTMKASRGRMASVEEAGADAEARVVSDEEKQRAELAEAMAGLGEEYREVVLMRFVDGMSVEETAGALEVAEGTVKSRLSRAMEMLRNDPRAKRYFIG